MPSSRAVSEMEIWGLDGWIGRVIEAFRDALQMLKIDGGNLKNLAEEIFGNLAGLLKIISEDWQTL